MRRLLAIFPGLALLSLLLPFSMFSAQAHAAAPDKTIASRTATVEGVSLHT